MKNSEFLYMQGVAVPMVNTLGGVYTLGNSDPPGSDGYNRSHFSRFGAKPEINIT